MISWLQGWWETFMIWAFDRETWHYLTAPLDPDDFQEAPRP
jgi:hypothetical protein